MTTKTATLWEVDGWHDPDGPGLMGYCTISVPGHHQGIRVYGDRLVAEYRATLIVRVVNAHDALVVVARAARRLGAYLYCTQNPGTLPQEYRDLEAALELVEGKE